VADHNPYVGPASFEEDDRKRFFGRDDEARELSYLLIARPAVLLYAQSGAGKTSLLQAKVIPDLRESGEMRVLPITRVSGPAEGGNVYVANALTGLKLTAATLTEALAPFFREPRDGEEEVPHLLIFDQFEEIFTFRPELTGQRREFFEQLRDGLAAYPKLGLLLSMREDYLADIDAFAGYLPDRLRNRMRMERLSDQQAEEAIARPAANAGKPFDDGVARRLVDDLRRVQTSRTPSARGTVHPHALGQYVEPVQLQIVCRQLWSRLPEEATGITTAHIETLARVDDALTNFYRDALTAVRQKVPTLSERALRRWFGEHLITSAKTRGMVYQGAADTGGLPNAAVDILREKYILRADIRPSGTWYELAHDRLVEPILADNLEWRAGHENPVADAYERSVGSGGSPKKLLSGTLLAEALDFARKNPAELTSEERVFLDSSREEARKARIRQLLGGASVAVALLVLWPLLEYVSRQKRRADEAHARQLAADAMKEASPEVRLLLAEAAVIETYPKFVVTEAVLALQSALQQEAQSIGETFPTVSLNAPSAGAGSAFSADLRRLAVVGSGKVSVLSRSEKLCDFDLPSPHVILAFSRDGARLAGRDSTEKTAKTWVRDVTLPLCKELPGGDVADFDFVKTVDRLSAEGSPHALTIRDPASGQVDYELHETAHIETLIAVSPHRTRLATEGGEGVLLNIWDSSGKKLKTIPILGGVRAAVFSPDDLAIAALVGSSSLTVWDASSGRTLFDIKVPSVGIGPFLLAFNVEGKQLAMFAPNVAFNSRSAVAKVWNVGGPFSQSQNINSLLKNIDSLLKQAVTLKESHNIWMETGLCNTYSVHSDHCQAIALRDEGMRSATAGNLNEAIADFKRAQRLDAGLKLAGLKLDPEPVARRLRVQQLMTDARRFATAGKLNEAIADFKRAQRLDSSLKLDPEREAKRLRAQELMGEARGWAARGDDFSEAIKRFQEVKSLDPTQHLDPLAESKRIRVGVLKSEGQMLARKLDSVGAIKKFEEIKSVDASSTIDPEAETRRWVASGRVAQGNQAARFGTVTEALAAFTEARKLDPDSVNADSWNNLCWFGSLGGHARDVLAACETAVRLGGGKDEFRDSRGLARALTGNKRGAVEDFEEFARHPNLESRKKRERQAWISVLRRGGNPFTPDVLKAISAE
jgi:tetratricopeptide (TPR) repeat protein